MKAQRSDRWWRQNWFLGLLLFAAVLIAYQKVWHAGFIWDDDQHITQNPVVVGPLGFKEIWTTRAARICPLVISTFWLEHKFWGLNPLPYHLFNLVMHSADALVLWRLLSRLKVPGAWLGAALWALHPVQVETVAWVTELKNTQSCFFYLLAIRAFVRWCQRKSELNYSAALGFAALAMASKSSTVVLPLVLGLVLWWFDRQLTSRKLLRLAPFFVLSLITSAWSMYSQKLEGAKDVEFALSLPVRLAVAGKAVWFYLSKLLWPYPLTFIYPRWEIEVSNPLSFLSTISLLAVLLFLFFQREKYYRATLFGFAYFVIALLPVLALVDHYFLRYSFVGDHFQYLASIGPLALMAAGITILARTLAPIVGAVVLIGMSFLSWKQSAMYKDGETLWETTLRQNPQALMAYNNLGTLRLGEKRIDEAITLFERAIEIKPQFDLAHFNLGKALFDKKLADQAISHYYTAMSSASNSVVKAMIETNLAGALVEKGELDQAIVHYGSALASDPSAEVQTNLGYVLFLQGKIDDAIACYENALKMNPKYAEAYFNLGVAYQKQGRIEASIGQYQRALELRPSYNDAANNLAWILATSRQDSLRNGSRAVALAEMVSRSDKGNSAAVLDTLAAAYAEAGRYPEAVETAQRALDRAQVELNPALATDLKQKLALYLARQPFRDSSS